MTEKQVMMQDVIVSEYQHGQPVEWAGFLVSFVAGGNGAVHAVIANRMTGEIRTLEVGASLRSIFLINHDDEEMVASYKRVWANQKRREKP